MSNFPSGVSRFSCCFATSTLRRGLLSDFTSLASTAIPSFMVNLFPANSHNTVLFSSSIASLDILFLTEDLNHGQVIAGILIRVERLSSGNPGDVKPVGKVFLKWRIDYGPGYRVYYKETGQKNVILLAGGDNRNQSKDIKTAQRFHL